MTRMTEEELLAKSAKNRKAKADTWRAAIREVTKEDFPSREEISKRIANAQVARVSKTGKVGKFKPLQPLKPTKAEKFAKIKLPTEHQEQVAVIAWCDAHPIAKHIFAIPNGANKSFASAAKFKREGLRKGVPDLFLPVRRGSFCGLFIEMKRKINSNVSAEQKEWVKFLNKDYAVRVCKGSDEAIALIREYLDIKET
jgi:hypothetical protein